MFALDRLHSLADLTRIQRAARPDAIAQIFEGRETTFATLDARASRIANVLAAEGLVPQSRIAYLGKNSDRFFELVFGAFKANVVMVSVNWRLALPEMIYIIEDARCELLFVSAEYVELVAPLRAACPRLRLGVAMDGAVGDLPAFEAWRDAQPDADPQLAVGADDDVVQLYTSGTTGHPKGVQLTTGNYLALFRTAEAARWGDFQPGEVTLACMPVFHVAGLNIGVMTMAQGATCVIVRDPDPGLLLDYIPRYRVNHAFFVPALILFLLQHPAVANTDFSSLRKLYYGASPIAEELLRRAKAVFDCAFFQLYGLTETCGAGTCLPDDAHDPARGKLRACGLPYPGIDIAVLGADGAALPPGEVGEIAIRTGVVMKGYWGRPEATAEAIRDGWFRTGDAGYFDADGYLYIHDRVKDMIVSGGENIYPAEVENAVFGHPDVADVAVIGVPDDKWGESVKAVVVLKPGARAQAEDIIAYTRSRIAGYKIPRSIDFVDALPRNPSGKILRRELREPYWKGKTRQVN
ncbi:MAG: long-chain-fatty-acid--CoA ligase [Gammaproteobacteria bacterium]